MTESLSRRVHRMKPGKAKDFQLALLEGLYKEGLRWPLDRRSDQTPPPDGFWDVWIYSGGRGAGKTRTGAEEVKAFAESTPNGRILLIARTAADVREVLIEGESGILSVYRDNPDDAPMYTPATRRLKWKNGAMAFATSADEADSIRGIQAHFTWADELASWRFPAKKTGKLSAWDYARLATRLGINPRIIVTTTPKKSKALKQIHKQLKADPLAIRLTQASTWSNAEALSPGYMDAVRGVFEGSALSKTELDGQWPWRL